MGRLIVELLLGALIFSALLAAAHKYSMNTKARRPKKELDLSARPSMWYTYSREVPLMTPGETEVGIQRVANDDKEILEVRKLTVIVDHDPDYKAKLDAALDTAYETMRVANVHLNRR